MRPKSDQKETKKGPKRDQKGFNKEPKRDQKVTKYDQTGQELDQILTKKQPKSTGL